MVGEDDIERAAAELSVADQDQHTDGDAEQQRIRADAAELQRGQSSRL